jgi:hypothetical protein
MPVTRPPRTLLDMAILLPLDELESLVAEAQYRRLAGDAELRDQIERHAGRRGVRALREVLDLPGGPRRTRSPAERSLLGLLRRRGIEGYEVNARVEGREVDFSGRLSVWWSRSTGMTRIRDGSRSSGIGSSGRGSRPRASVSCR